MFDFLKTMTAPHFSVVDYGEGLVYFRCSKKLSLAETVAGYAVLPGGEKHPLCVQVVQRRSDGIYLGRPTEGELRDEDSLAPVSRRLGELLGREVRLVRDWVDGGFQVAPGDPISLEVSR